MVINGGCTNAKCYLFLNDLHCLGFHMGYPVTVPLATVKREGEASERGGPEKSGAARVYLGTPEFA